VGSSSTEYEPVTLPPKSSNLPSGLAPSKTRGALLVKAAMREASVNVVYNSDAVVRNSAESLRVVTLTFFPLPESCVLVAEVWFDLVTWELETYLGVEKPLEGLEPGAC